MYLQSKIFNNKVVTKLIAILQGLYDNKSRLAWCWCLTEDWEVSALAFVVVDGMMSNQVPDAGWTGFHVGQANMRFEQC